MPSGTRLHAALATFPVWLLAAGLWGALALAGCRHPPHPGRGNNVVLVVVDTVRQDHLAAYGYARDPAPFASGLARQGAVFDGLSPSSWTKPATASLLTGLHPVSHQAIDRQDRLPAAALTLAELLRRNGYQTLGASANGWVSPAFGFAQGFGSFLFRENYAAADLNRELFARLEKLRPPFFLYVHYIDPHAPYDPAVGWNGRELPPDLRRRGPVRVEDLDGPHFVRRPRELLARARDLYDGEIREADDALRELVGRLAGRGLMKGTILVLASDHGEEFEDHGRMSHGQTLYEEVLRVPLIFHAPHLFPAGRRLGRASLVDVLPTLRDLLGLASEGGRWDGEDLAEQLTSGRSEPMEERPFLAHLDFIDGTGLALTRGRDKLVLGKNPYRKQLFDLAADPAERRDLFGSPQGRAAYSRLAADIARLYNGYARGRLQRTAVKADPFLTQSLAALGYVATSRPNHPRVIPSRIRPPGPTPGGRLGWEAVGSQESCVHLERPDADRYLLDGWYPPEPEGRWSDRRATLALSVPPQAPRFELMLSGSNYRPTPVRMRVSLAHRPVLNVQVMPGPFRFSANVARVASELPALVEIVLDSAFVPSQHGLPDDRSLGLFVSRVCVEPAPMDYDGDGKADLTAP